MLCVLNEGILSRNKVIFFFGREFFVVFFSLHAQAAALETRTV